MGQGGYFGTKKHFSVKTGMASPHVPSREHQKKKGLPCKKAGEGIVLICPKCHAVYFDKAWHSNKFLSQAYRWNRGIQYKICPEDKWQESGGGGVNYEGELVIDGIPQRLLMEVARQVRNIAKRAETRDPQDKITRLEISGSRIRVFTTENQLAVSIGKQISEAHKGGKLEINWSECDKPARVYWKYKKRA